MKTRRPAAASAVLLAAVLCVPGPPALAASEEWLGPPSLEQAIDGGLPGTAAAAFRRLPQTARATSAALPKLMRALGEAGLRDEALALFEETRKALAEPVRSAAFFAAGSILLEKKDYDAALDAFRRVSPGSPEAAPAAARAARILAARGDHAQALRILSAVPADARTRLSEGWARAAAGDMAGAAAVWSQAPPGRAAAVEARALALAAGRGPAEGFVPSPAPDDAALPERVLLQAALAQRMLSAGERGRALDAAGDGLAAVRRLKEEAARLPGWDGTAKGAEDGARALELLFPYAEPMGEFAAARGAFRTEAALHRSLAAAEAGARSTARRWKAAGEALAARQAEVSRGIARAERIASELAGRRRRLDATRNRLVDAAKALSLPALGDRLEPDLASRLARAQAAVEALRGRIARAAAAAEAASRAAAAGGLPAGDAKMAYFAASRVARIDDAAAALEGRLALARGRAWNRWKAAFAAKAAAILDSAEAASAAAARQERRAAEALGALRSLSEDILAWRSAAARYGAALDRSADALARRREQVRERASRRFEAARSLLISAVSRRERALSYIAARAATEQLTEEPAGDRTDAAPPPARREALRAEAMRHWEAVLSSAAKPGFADDEALYALAELRFAEAESRAPGEDRPQAGLERYGRAVALFDRLVGTFPSSPYAEPALYGMALCLDAAGAPDNAAAALSALLARNPKTRYADEIHLRLGEHEFDRDDFAAAEAHYRAVRPDARPDVRATALFKLGWSLFLQERFEEAAEQFLSALLASAAASRTGGVADEALGMAARALVEANRDRAAEEFLARRGASARAPALLLRIQSLLEAQNRYADAAAAADRLAAAGPLSPERVDAEIAAARALAKAGREEDAHARRAGFARAFGPGSAWQAAPGRQPAEIARANIAAEEGLRTAAFFFHERSRKNAAGDREAVLAMYDEYLARFPGSPKGEEVAYQRAWLLFEQGRKAQAKAAFESVARNPRGPRAEGAAYMAVQCAKELSDPRTPASLAEIDRLAREYEAAHPRGARLPLVLSDRAHALFGLKEFRSAAGTAERAAALLPGAGERRAVLRLAADARFEGEDYEGAEAAYRALRAGAPPAEAADLERWIGAAMFRRAERVPADRPAEAAETFRRIAAEFPALDIAPTARFRAAAAFAEAGRDDDAVELFLLVERDAANPARSHDAAAWLARLFERKGRFPDAAERLWRLAADETDGVSRVRLLLRAAELFERGKDGARMRSALARAARDEAATASERVGAWFRAAESALAEGKDDEADALYAEVASAHEAAPQAAPELAGKAAFRRAERRFAAYLAMEIAPPLEKRFGAKQAALTACAALYTDAIRLADAETAAAALHRLGEGFENFRSAILASPPPPGLTPAEKEEYVFLLEEKAAPIEEKAVEAYLANLRRAVSGDVRSPWVARSLARLRALRPARFARAWEYAFPVLTLPEFVGVIEREAP